MKALIQRVSEASVTFGEPPVTRRISQGFVVLLGIGKNDAPDAAKWMAEKTANLRIFSNEEGKFDKSLLDIGGECLVVSQFTLYGDAKKGRRPDFTLAAAPQDALAIYKLFIAELKKTGIRNVQEGEFQAHMRVSLTNDGPVTIMIET
ncbi:MAG: D-tyrosyl-tRNA(Tyr) deacylase [Elusimicrobia bacterium]|nr:D-tyrosyl-tRNA(Tyr) deacylase [Elusimicrobiota bacterium]